jgi:hypothetical protein
MARRLDLQTLLKATLGSENVYFQPPQNLNMHYPCIVYHRDGVHIDHANDEVYHGKIRYLVTVIDQNPDSEVPTRVAKLPLCRFTRHYAAENLNHDTFNLFF